jgi:hypothetical protein
MGLLNSLSKTISVMLQYHIPPQNISKMLRGQKSNRMALSPSSVHQILYLDFRSDQ